MEKYRFPYEKLEVWQGARQLVKMVYEITRRFPPEEKFGLTSQINRAAVSVASNLAEGSSRTSYKDQAHFTQLSFSSLMEVACQVTLANDLGMLRTDNISDVRKLIEELSRRLNALRQTQLKRVKK